MKKIISAFLITALFLAVGLFVAPSATQVVAKSEIEQLKDQLSSLQSEQKRIEEEKSAISNEIDTMLLKKNSLDEDLQVTNSQIRVIEKMVSNLNTQIAVKQAEIDDLTNEYNNFVSTFRERAREAYERGESSYLSMIVGAEDISGLLEKIDLMSQVSEYENSLLEKIEKDAQTVKQLKSDLDKQKKEQQEQLSSLQSVKARQQSTMADISETVAALEDNQESLAAQQKAYEEKEAALDKQISALASPSRPYSGDELLWPVPASSTISSGYGYRSFDNSFHAAIDISAPGGTPIIASEKGTVVYAKWVTTGGGNKIVIDHGSGLVTNYNHLSSFAVSTGQTVSKGQVIGYVGATGFATGNHLDFRILFNGTYLNPTDYVNYSNSAPRKSIKDLIG